MNNTVANARMESFGGGFGVSPVKRSLTREEEKLVPELVCHRRLDLISHLSGVRYGIEACCARCNRKITSPEIMNGFYLSFMIDGVQCPKCKEPVQAYISGVEEVGRIHFHGPKKTRSRLCEEIRRLNGKKRTLDNVRGALIPFPSFIHSAVIHHGALENACKRVSFSTRLAYPNWREQVKPYIGELPDLLIAAVVGTTSDEVRKYRNGLEVSMFENYKLLSDMPLQF